MGFSHVGWLGGDYASFFNLIFSNVFRARNAGNLNGVPAVLPTSMTKAPGEGGRCRLFHVSAYRLTMPIERCPRFIVPDFF